MAGEPEKTQTVEGEATWSLRVGRPPLDINIFRTEKGGNPEIVRESQRRRNPVNEKDSKEDQAKQQEAQNQAVAVVDGVIKLDEDWRKAQYETEQLKKKQREMSKEIGKMMKTDKDKAQAMKAEVGEVKKQLEENEKRSEQLGGERDALMATIGNIVHMDIKVSNDEDVSTVVGAYGTGPLEYDPTGKLGGTDIRRNTESKPEEVLNHVDLCHRLDMRDTEAGGGAAEGTKVAGGRAYFLKGHGCMLNQALINYGLVFLARRGYTQMHCPFFMRQSMMGQCAQLSQFDEELYKVTGEGEDKYLIATSEQALCAYHQGKRIEKTALPTRYAGYSSCFRKEAGSHGRDQLGIFRVHQFEKVEQFVLASPEGDKSWELMKQNFYQSLQIPYKVIDVVTGELNLAAARKYDLEAWFPGSRCYRELVSCSNCLDYQARRLDTRIAGGAAKNVPSEHTHVHMLNSTLTATSRTICCILENYQTPDGVRIPEVLQPFMGGIDFMPFQQPLPTLPDEKKGKKKKK